MSTPALRPAGLLGEHPVVASRRLRDALALAAAGVITTGVSLGIAIEMPKPNYTLVLGGLIGLAFLGLLVMSPRLEWSVAALVFYLGCIAGPLKLIGSTGTVGSALQDVFIIAILLSLLIRSLAGTERWRLAPLSGWVLAFVAVVVLEAFNPKTLNVLKVGAGFREQLQFVPFFIFGYLLLRSKASLRKAFLLIGVLALANGVISTYQSRLSPQQAASWGAGYEMKYEGKASRTFKSEGVNRIRPTGLGDESGTGGSVGIVALAGTLALLAMARRKRGLLLLLCFGSLAAIATSAARIDLVGGVLALVGYAILTATAGRDARRPLRLLAGFLALTLPVGLLFVSVLGTGVFSRYESLLKGGGTSAVSYKEDELKALPAQIAASPFGFGLGTAGPAAGFGGRETELYEGHNVNAETTYNFIFKEVGVPGLIVWAGTMLMLLWLAFSRIHLLADPELKTYLAAVFAPVFAMFFMSFEGPLSQSEILAPFFWFALGVASYWLAGEGFRRARRRMPVPARLQLAAP